MSKYRITYIDNIDRKAYTKTFRETRHGRREADEQWRVVTESPYTLCAVFYSPLGDLKRWNIGKIGEWER